MSSATQAEAPHARDLPRLAALALQLALVLAVVHLFGIEENYGLLRLSPFLFGGFVVHALLPKSLRMPFFLLLSLASLTQVLSLKNTIGLVGAGLLLFTLCHYPRPMKARVALLLFVAAIFALLRARFFTTFWESFPTRVLPILASMFMFRIVLYLYYIRHEKTSASIWHRLTYFFLMPNAYFPLFPVIDYRTFLKTWYDRDDIEIYQKGVHWLLRGVVQLLLYRIVYHYFTPGPSQVHDLGGVTQFMVSGYLLYLRISGLFHLITGILHLFGFNLPQTHNQYLLATSFTDFWRRINIYWKDFMQNTVYFPLFMRFRHLGMERAMAISTLATLVISWMLHSYQWFWFVGTFPIKAQDAGFWILLGVLVAINAVLEVRFGRRKAPKTGFVFASALRLSVQTVAMFTFMCVFWSFWTSSSLADWTSVIKVAFGSGPAQWAVLLLGLVALVAAGVLAQFLREWNRKRTGGKPASWRRQAFNVGASAVALVAVAAGPVELLAGQDANAFVESLKGNRLNQRDEGLLTRGYYEELLGTDTLTTALWNFQVEKPDDWIHIKDSEATRRPGNMLVYELVPGVDIRFKRQRFVSNRWGMRDDDYPLEKPRDTYRIALLGASFSMGTGVAREDMMEVLVEERLRRRAADAGHPAVEVLNFSVGGYSVLQQVFLMDETVPKFEPDAILLVEHPNYDAWASEGLAKIVLAGVPIPYPFIHDVIARAGIEKGMTDAEHRRRLKPHGEEIVRWAYQRISDRCAERGTVPVWLYVPFIDSSAEANRKMLRVAEFARESGFVTISLEEAFTPVDSKLIQLATWDMHPNAKGHRLLADELYEKLTALEERLGMAGTGDEGRTRDE